MKRRVKCIHCRSRHGAKHTNNAGVQDSQTRGFRERERLSPTVTQHTSTRTKESGGQSLPYLGADACFFATLITSVARVTLSLSE